MKTLGYVISIIFLGFISGCSGQKNDARNCSQFNNLAVASVQEYLQKGRDTLNLLKAIDFYDKAIECDPSNVLNYQGKLTAANILGRYNVSLKLTEKLYRLSGEADIQMLVSKAVIFERIGEIDSSKSYFDRALEEYTAQLKNNPPDSLRIICERLYLIAIIRGKDQAMEELKYYLDKYPNDPDLKVYEDILRNFDRKTILPDN